MHTTTGSAERLQRAGGAWRLEFQQLVYNSPTLLRPRRFAVQGEQAILQQLREFANHEPLAKDTERLFARGALPDGTYVVRDGRWFPELRPDTLAEPPPEPKPKPEKSAASGPSLVEELLQRISGLEARVRDMQETLDRALEALAQAAQARVAMPQPALQQTPAAPAPVPIAEPERSSARPPQPMVAGVPLAQPSIPGVASPLSAALPAREGRAAIALPPLAALSDLVKSLAGPDAVFVAQERTDWHQVADRQPVFCAVIQDNDGDEAGSMIFDLEAALRLAGALLMESDEVVESLLEEKVMSDEMLDAASEVCNTLTSAFNKVSGNPHLRAGKLQPFSEARAAELMQARKRDDYRYSKGGRATMVAR